MKARIVLLALIGALLTLGFQCINDSVLISVNLKGITGTFKINPGSGAFDDRVTVTPNDYVDYSDKDLSNPRIYDIRVSTTGTYAGNISGRASVNGVDILAYNGSFTYFNTPRSLLNDPNITRFSGGITALVNAVINKDPITLRGYGNATPGPFPDGQYITIEVLGQVDVEL